MKILLVGPDYEENLSIRYLSAALLNAGHETVLAPFNSLADIPQVARAAQFADLVGLSMCFQALATDYLRLAQRIKSEDPHKLIVAGGHYASCAAEPLLANHPELDLIVIHEGEQALVEIADATPNLEERLPEIPGIAYRKGCRILFTNPRHMRDDLDTLPIPDRRGPVHTIAGVPTSYMMGSRGCYENCAYCCITTLHRLAPGKRFRQRSVERIADEMATLYHERGTRQFVFHDDNFLVPSTAFNHARISEFETALHHRSIKDIALLIKCRPADVNREVFRRLKTLGLVRVFLGVESATACGLSSLERRQTVEDSERALEICAEFDISALFTLMIFNPDTTVDTLRSDLAFMRHYAGNPLNFCRTQIYAGTPLEKRMIESGRARGDYLARDYGLLDPAADLACTTALDLFYARCSSIGGLMHNTIGLDHSAAVLKRFYKGSRKDALVTRVANWLRSVNLDTLDLLEDVIECNSSLTALHEREYESRGQFLAEAARLRTAFEAFRLGGSKQPPSLWPRVGRKAAAALIAIGTAAAAPIPDQAVCSMTGIITDPTSAVVPKVKVTITNEEVDAVRNASTDDDGRYIANGLAPGQYTVKAEMAGFRPTVLNHIALHAGVCERVDVSMQLQIGSAEMISIEGRPRRVRTLNEEIRQWEKPFVYVVGTLAKDDTLQGVAKAVYGNTKAWIQIFEANRDVVPKPGPLKIGTRLLIPPRYRNVPTLVHKVRPEPAHTSGDVLLDVTLNENGTVAQTSTIDGNPDLAEAAVKAVKQWRYRPLLVNGKLVLKFVVLISFDKDGKVR